ncbi:UNKNOWN [Stylonychia lemnae]|uniref:Uncharacterized protein n=1 Tax=Stylonychia lemnae TaxID=5949 RepID=A0A077ZSH1_STYLE|nr:UNKNOWN [Stylonychia lemnae]|eukprot:CDW72504.1 UNKNOWN [Stylonychia lemnae]
MRRFHEFIFFRIFRCKSCIHLLLRLQLQDIHNYFLGTRLECYRMDQGNPKVLFDGLLELRIVQDQNCLNGIVIKNEKKDEVVGQRVQDEILVKYRMCSDITTTIGKRFTPIANLKLDCHLRSMYLVSGVINRLVTSVLISRNKQNKEKCVLSNLGTIKTMKVKSKAIKNYNEIESQEIPWFYW